MKICISEQSVKDFNAFFAEKAVELQSKNNYTSTGELYRALYNEALAMSGNTESMDNHDVVLQHLSISPIALSNKIIPGLQEEVRSDALDVMSALKNVNKLESLINKIQKVITTPIEVVEKEIKIVKTEAEVEDYDPNAAIHMSFETTQGSETTGTENNVDNDKVTAHAASRTILDKIKNGSKDYQFLAMPYSKLESRIKEKLDLSITSIPQNARNAGNQIVLIIVDKAGNPVQFDGNGNITDNGVVPVYSPLSHTKVSEAHYQYVNGKKDLTIPLHKKFAAIEASFLAEGFSLEEIHRIPNKNNRQTGLISEGYVEGKSLFASIREQGSMILNINPAISTFGYNSITKNKTALSNISNINNLTLSTSVKPDGTFHILTGGDLHDSQAAIIPNDISSNPELVDILVELLTNKNLTENGTKLNASRIKELISNYTAVNTNSPLRYSSTGKVTIYNKTATEKQIREYFNTFQATEPVTDNREGRVITKDLLDPNNTSAMLYQGNDGHLYKIYKPKFSFNNESYKVVSIKDGKVTTTSINKVEHVVKNSSTKAFVNSDGILKVYHPKIGYDVDPASYENQPGLNKLKEQKGENAEVTLDDEQHAMSWFKGSPLAQVLQLTGDKLASEDRPENRVAVAKWIGDGIILFKGSDYTDIYHESWHAYTQGLLSHKDKIKLYNSVRKLKGKSNFSNLQVEEYLAEEFRAYAIGKSKLKKTSLIGRYFENILNYLKGMFGMYSKSDLASNSVVQDIVTKHFKNLYKGNIDITNYKSENFMFNTLNKSMEFPNSGLGIVDRLSAQQTSLLMGTVDSLVSSYLDANNVDKLSKGYSSIDNLKAAYNGALHELIKLNEEQNKLAEQSAPRSDEYNTYLKNIEMLEAAIDNFGDVEKMGNNIFAGTDPTNVIGYHLRNGKVYNYNTISDIIQEDDQQAEADVTGKIFERTGHDQSLFDMADEHIVYMLSTINKQDTVRGTYTLKEAKKLGNQKLYGKLKFGQKVSTNILGVPVLERPAVVMAKLGKLLNSTANGDVMYQRMLDASKNDAVMKEVLAKLGPYQTDSLDQTILWSKFIQTFSKSNNKLQQFIIETKVNKNNTLDVTSKYGTTLGGTKSVERAWNATFPGMPSEYLETNIKGVEINAEEIINDFLIETSEGKWKLKNVDSHVNFYRSLGINITDNAEIEKALASKYEVLNAVANRLKNHVQVNNYNKLKGKDALRITSLKALFGPHETLNYEQTETIKVSGLNSYYNSIQQIEFDLSDKFNSFMSINAPGETQSELSLNSSASVVTNDINSIAEGTSIEEVIREFPHLKFLDTANDPMMKASRYYKLLFTEEGLRTDVKLTLNNFSGSTLLQKEGFLGLTNMDLDVNAKFMTDVYLSYYNKSEVTRMADKVTSLHMGIDSAQTFGPAEIIEAMSNVNDTTMYNQLKDYLVAEIVRVNLLNEIKENGTAFDKAYGDRSNKLFIFDDIFDSNTKQELLSLTDSTDFDTVSKAINNLKGSNLVNQVNDYFTKKTSYMVDNFSSDLFITDNVMNSILTELPEEFQNKNKNDIKEIMIGMFQRNKFLHNLDFTTFHLGDPAIYNVESGDFSKRNAGYISTGDIFRTDKAFSNFINSKNDAGKLKSRGWSNKVTNNKSGHKDYDNKIHTGVIADHIATSEYLGELRTALGEDFDLSSYEKMEEADGQGVVGFDSYRMMSISQGIWTDQQQEQYELIINRATEDKDGNIIPGNYDQTKFNEFFPSMKLQYFGPLDTNSPLRQQAFHKFNLVPLIPGMIKGTKLESLSQKMMEQGLDYVTFKSGSKLGTLSKDSTGSDQYYNKDRTLNDNLIIEDNVIFTKYLKNQLKIGNKFKSKVTLPTQMRSILVSNLFEKDGSYKGSTAKEKKETEQWHKDYLKNLTEIRNYKEQELYNELGIKDLTSLIEDSSKLVNMIRREFTSKDYTESQIEFLFEDGNLKSDISTSLTSDQVEKLLVSLIDKRITKLKVNGEGLIQVASTMSEKSGTTQVKGDLESGTNALRSYYNKDGVTIGAQIKIALQGDFEKLLYTKGVDGKLIAKFITYENADGSTTTELDYDLSLARLNDTIKNKSWLAKNKNLLRAVAPRIPSQGFNSLEFMEVAEFLPKNTGNIMIVPSEIVAKSGSDFDVDKLFTMFPNIELYNGKAEIVKHTSINTDVSTIKSKIKEVNVELKEIRKALKPLYAELTEAKELIKIDNKINSLLEEYKTLEGNSDELSVDRANEIQSDVSALMYEQAEYYDEINEDFNEGVLTSEELTQEKKDIWKQITPLKESADKLQTTIDNYNREINGASIKGLENELIDLIARRLSMKNVFPELIKPNTNDLVEPLAKELADFATDYKQHERINGTQTYNKNGDKQISTTQIFDPIYNINKGLENAVGKDTLGIGAISAKFASIFQSIGMYLNPTNGLTHKEYENLIGKRNLTPTEQKAFDNHVDYRIQLDHNTRMEEVNGVMQSVIDLSRNENISEEKISDVLGQLINGWVDVAKDPWIFNIQGNKEVVPTLTFLITAGVDFRQAVMLSSSKLVRDYIGAKKELNGAFHGLQSLNQDDSYTFNLIRNYSDVDALNLVLKNENYEKLDSINEVYKESRDFKSPLDIKKNGTIEKLIKNPEKIRTEKEQEQELQALLQFVAYEQTAKQITNLTMATKFDTSTSSSLAEVRNMQEKYDTLHQQEALPKDIKQRIENSPVGMFNTNELQLSLWSQFFRLKTHTSLSQAANKGVKERYQKGRTQVDNEKDFSDEFLSYLYQNESSRIENNSYKGYEIYKLEEKSEEPYIYEDGKFFFNENYINTIVEDSAYGYGNSNSVKKYYIEKHIAGENLDINKVKDTLSYKMAEKAVAEDKTKDIIDQYTDAEAIIKSGNSEQLFEGLYTYSNRLNELKLKYPELEKQFNLVADLYPDTNDSNRENLYLINLKEESYKSIYEENLAVLKDHFNPEIKEFFKMFDRYAVLQSGVKSYGKYVLTSVIDQNFLDKTISPIRKDVLNELDSLEDGKQSQYALLDNFSKQYFKKDNFLFKDFLMNKNRGTQYETDSYFNNDFRELSKRPLTLDAYSDRYVDVMDQEMAKISDKVMIHKVSNFPVKAYKERSKINGYYAFANQNHTDALDNDYSTDTSIWIVGETLNEYAAGGKNNMIKYQEVLDRNFLSYQESINDAIEQGVQTFNVGNNVGIDTMVQKFLRSKPGFYQHKIVTKDGSYMQYSKTKEVTPEQLYSTLEGEINVNDRFTTPLKDIKVNLTIGNSKPAANIFHHLLRTKSLLATREETIRLKNEIDKKGGVDNLTEPDWINLIGTIKLGVNKTKYNETYNIKKAIAKIISSNPQFESELKKSGKSLLTLGNGRTEFERNFGRALLEARAEYFGKITASTTIELPSYISNPKLTNKDGSKLFASTNGTTITINPVTNTQELFDYMEGRTSTQPASNVEFTFETEQEAADYVEDNNIVSGTIIYIKEEGYNNNYIVRNEEEIEFTLVASEVSPTSQQKAEVLKELSKQGYTMDVIKEILSTNELANTFLILHEQDHIDNNDKDVYWASGKDLLTADKIAIETRATISALRKIEIEKANGEDPITCKI